MRPLILLPGLAGSKHWWRHNIAAFEPPFRVHAIDRPGYPGLQDRPDEWLRHVIDVLEPNDPVSLIGHSTGGLICAWFAAANPGRVHRMVLAAPSIDLRHRSIVQNLLPLAKTCLQSAPSFWPRLLIDAARAGPVRLLHSARELFEVRMMPMLPAVEAPTLLVWGERDSLVPASCAPGIQSAIPGSRLHVIPRAGHVVMWDAPAEFNRVALDFLTSDEPAA